MQFSVIVTLCLLGFFSLNSAEKSSSLRSDKSDKKRDSLATKVKDNRKGDIMRDMPMKLDPKGKGKGGKDFKMAPKGGMNSMKFEPRGKEFGKHAGKGKMKALDWERAPMNWKMSAKGYPKGGKEFGKFYILLCFVLTLHFLLYYNSVTLCVLQLYSIISLA